MLRDYTDPKHKANLPLKRLTVKILHSETEQVVYIMTIFGFHRIHGEAVALSLLSQLRDPVSENSYLRPHSKLPSETTDRLGLLGLT